MPTKQHIQDNRRHPRVAVSLPVYFNPRQKYKAANEPNGSSPELSQLEGRAKDLSLGGLCLITRQPLKKDDFVEVELDLLSLPHRVKAFSNVVWAEKFEDREDTYRLGIQFIEMKSADQDLVRNYISQKLPKTPQAPPTQEAADN